MHTSACGPEGNRCWGPLRSLGTVQMLVGLIFVIIDVLRLTHQLEPYSESYPLVDGFWYAVPSLTLGLINVLSAGVSVWTVRNVWSMIFLNALLVLGSIGSVSRYLSIAVKFAGGKGLTWVIAIRLVLHAIAIHVGLMAIYHCAKWNTGSWESNTEAVTVTVTGTAPPSAPSQSPPTHAQTEPPSYAVAATMPSPAHSRRSSNASISTGVTGLSSNGFLVLQDAQQNGFVI